MNGRWPVILIGLVILAAAVVFGLSRRQAQNETSRQKEAIHKLEVVLGLRVCREWSQAVAFKPTKTFPKKLIDTEIRSLQQQRHELGLSPCQRKEHR